mmetsp:Transcript_65436/g.189600  ORF Transcript_65436/g.189600 Transcript_65436/m.189600 type:complete len:201 (-) Transcript_65436:304-906(-)
MAFCTSYGLGFPWPLPPFPPFDPFWQSNMYKMQCGTSSALFAHDGDRSGPQSCCPHCPVSATRTPQTSSMAFSSAGGDSMLFHSSRSQQPPKRCLFLSGRRNGYCAWRDAPNADITIAAPKLPMLLWLRCNSVMGFGCSMINRATCFAPSSPRRFLYRRKAWTKTLHFRARLLVYNFFSQSTIRAAPSGPMSFSLRSTFI